jgi:hypothetical protein
VTPFMAAVAEILDGEPPAPPETTPSEACTVAEAANAQVAIRSLAEQLVSEANVVLHANGSAIELTDEVGPGALTFTLAYRDRAARVRTNMQGRTATAHVTLPGAADGPDRQLASEDEVRALVLTLLA